MWAQAVWGRLKAAECVKTVATARLLACLLSLTRDIREVKFRFVSQNRILTNSESALSYANITKILFC